MWTLFSEGLIYLSSQSTTSFLLLFWPVVIFEVPRYFLLFIAAVISGMQNRSYVTREPVQHRVSMVIAGHNEADAVEACVLGLRQQSRLPDEIILVSDGSTDDMPARMQNLLRRGWIDEAHHTDLRAGKSAATNLACRHATGDILVNIDLDCSFDRHAIRNVIRPFADPEIGAVSGNIQVDKPMATLVTAFQAIEYLISIALGKRAAAMTDHVVCVSGAFGAFRQTALSGVGGLDVGGGEDLDCTLRLRKSGWKIGFAEDAIAYTQPPATVSALVRQRFRWERDALRLRYRKHGAYMNPFSRQFIFHEFLHEVEFAFFNIVAALAMPFYLIWLFVTYGDLAMVILVAAYVALIVLDCLTFCMAAIASPLSRNLALLPYVPGYSLFYGMFMRTVRLAAYMQEWLFDASSNDPYVPKKVVLMRRW